MLLRFLPCLLALWAASPLGAAAANISVNAASQVNTFKPANIFGNNVAYWAGTGANNATQGRVQAAGNYLIRYPGGSSSDDFHWNGNGSLDANGYWVPSNTNYSPSVVGTEKYRGTKSSYGPNSNLTDGNAATAWKSNADTDYPTSQWVYLDLGSTGSVSQVVITWGTPWATNFSLQTGSSTYNATSSNWTSIPGATNLAGVTGSAQTINFSAVSTRYIRILMTASSAGAGGAYSIAEVAVYNGSTAYTLTSNSHVASSTDPACTISGSAGFDFESYMSYIHLFTPQAQPLITVNFGEGTPQEAAAWVHYANVVKGYGIKYWEIGNELDGSWETGGPLPAEDYARRYIEFYEAMKAEDPTITVMGPVVSQPGNVANDFTGTSYIQAFVNRLASDSGGNKAAYANGIAFHWYPTWNNDMSNVAGVLANPSGWASLASNMSSWLVNHPAPSTVPIFLTEFNSGGTGNVTTDITNGLWYADWMGQMITKFGSRGYSTMWDVLNGGNAVTSPTGGDHAYLQAEANIYQYQQRAHYWAMQMMATQWSIQGDTRDHKLVSASSSNTNLTAYAALRPDDLLTLIVVNKDTTGTTYTATVSISGYAPNSSASRWTFDSSNYQWLTTATPYHAAPDTAPTLHSDTGLGSSFSYNFPPYSITLWQFSRVGTPTVSPTFSVSPTPTMTPSITNTYSASPTRTPSRTASPTRTITPNYTPTSTPSITNTFTISATFTISPTFTASPTITQTYTATPVIQMIDNFEDGDMFTMLPTFGGGWGTQQDGTGTISATVVSPGWGGSLHAMDFSGTRGAWCQGVCDLLPGTAPYNASGFTGVQFWFKGDGATYRFNVVTQDMTAASDFDYNGRPFTGPAGVWTHVQIPFSIMTQQGWGANMPLNIAKVTGFQFATTGGTSFDFQIDNLDFYTPGGDINLTATPTSTASPSGTPTISPTFSVSPTISETFTISPTFTPPSGPPVADDLWMVPHPIGQGAPGQAVLKADGVVDSIDVMVYSVNFVLLWQKTVPVSGQGPYYSVLVDAADTAKWPRGVSFLRMTAHGQGTASTKSRVLYVTPK